MNCEHRDETGLNDACEECLNDALAKEFASGREEGRASALRDIVKFLAARASELFSAHRDEDARLVRGLKDAVAQMAARDDEAVR